MDEIKQVSANLVPKPRFIFDKYNLGLTEKYASEDVDE